MDSDEILIIGGVVAGAYLLTKFAQKPKDVTTGASLLPSGNQNIEMSVFNPEFLNLRTETYKENSTYRIPLDNLSASEQRAIKYGFWDIEKDTLQYGLFQGVERKTRDWLTLWTKRLF